MLSTGEVVSGGAAAAPLAEELPGGRALAAVFRALPRTTDCVYRSVARNRERLARLVGADATCQLRR